MLALTKPVLEGHQHDGVGQDLGHQQAEVEGSASGPDLSKGLVRLRLLVQLNPAGTAVGALCCAHAKPQLEIATRIDPIVPRYPAVAEDAVRAAVGG